MNLNDTAFLSTLPVVVKGMAGIFLVTGVIILTAYLLNRFSSKK